MALGVRVLPRRWSTSGSRAIAVESREPCAIDAFTDSDPYHVNGVWEHVDVHYFNKKR